mgnify:FL=1|jgi:hypothetical protein
MIDTDKYEGHTPAPWLATHDLVETEAKYGGTFTHVINHNGWRVWVGEKDTDVPHLQNNRFGSENLDEADAKLIADAPLLLAEYKRLRNIILKFDDAIYHGNFDISQLLGIWYNLLTKEEEE